LVRYDSLRRYADKLEPAVVKPRGRRKPRRLRQAETANA
jgi:hypothetical protein